MDGKMEGMIKERWKGKWHEGKRREDGRKKRIKELKGRDGERE